jgi:putative acetyltransferase
MAEGASAHPDPGLSLRMAENRDAQDLFGLLALCFAEYSGCFVDPHDDLADLRRPEASFRGAGEAFWVMDDAHGRICACVAVNMPESGVAELHRLYVRPDQRGRGLGAALTRYVERHARENGAQRIRLWSDTRFTTAHRLYERLGYVRIDGQRELGDISHSKELCFVKPL